MQTRNPNNMNELAHVSAETALSILVGIWNPFFQYSIIPSGGG
jgi:hypothetical protein